MEKAVQFLDSWGNVWVVCDADHPEAVAFGPTGIARPTGIEAGELSDHFCDDGSGWLTREVDRKPVPQSV